jgi:hypothetical protein
MELNVEVMFLWVMTPSAYTACMIISVSEQRVVSISRMKDVNKIGRKFTVQLISCHFSSNKTRDNL